MYAQKWGIIILEEDIHQSISELKVDGGAVQNKFLMQFQSDLSGVNVLVPTVTETMALGVACLAGLATGVYRHLDEKLLIQFRQDSIISPRWTKKGEYNCMKDGSARFKWYEFLRRKNRRGTGGKELIRESILISTKYDKKISYCFV